MTIETVYGKRCPRCDDLICSKTTFMIRCATCGHNLETQEANVMYIASQNHNFI